MTFKFKETGEEASARLVGKVVGTNRVELLRRRTAQKEVYLNSIRPLINSINFASLKISSCEVRRVEQDICHRRSTRRTADFDSCNNQDLQVKGVTKNMNNWLADTSYVPTRSAASDRNTRMRRTAGCFRVKSQHTNLEIGGQGYSVEISGEMMRKPTIRKDHFVFGLSEKADSFESKSSSTQARSRTTATSSGRSTTPTACS